MTHETEIRVSSYIALHQQLISKVQTCLYKLRDTTISKSYMRIHADNEVLSEVQVERNMLIALLGELNASMIKTSMLDIDSVLEMRLIEKVKLLQQRVVNAEQHFLHTFNDVKQVMRRAS